MKLEKSVTHTLPKAPRRYSPYSYDLSHSLRVCKVGHLVAVFFAFLIKSCTISALAVLNWTIFKWFKLVLNS